MYRAVTHPLVWFSAIAKLPAARIAIVVVMAATSRAEQQLFRLMGDSWFYVRLFMSLWLCGFVCVCAVVLYLFVLPPRRLQLFELRLHVHGGASCLLYVVRQVCVHRGVRVLSVRVL